MTPFVRYVGGCLSRCSCVTIIRNSGSTTRISLYCQSPSGTSEQFNQLNKDSFPNLFGTTHLSSLLHITKHLALLHLGSLGPMNPSFVPPWVQDEIRMRV